MKANRETTAFKLNFIDFDEFRSLLGLQKTAFYKLIKNGSLPPTVEFLKGNVWRREVVENFIKSL